MKPTRLFMIALILVALALGFSGCTPGTGIQPPVPDSRSGPLRLVAYKSCEAAINNLKAAARLTRSQYWGPAVTAQGRASTGQAPSGTARSAAASAPGPETPVPDYSGTNVNEPGVDEPDIVKTDGRRIITVTNNVLHSVDAASHRLIGELLLPGNVGTPGELLLRGDRALVLFPSTRFPTPVGWADGQPNASDVFLVDLSGRTPRLAGTLAVDGSVVDARQVGAVVRLVVGSAPRVDPGNPEAIETATISDWLPHYSLTVDGRTSSGHVDCRQVSSPPHYSGLAMISVYSLDLDASSLSIGEPATVVADGEVVYGVGTSLYLAARDRWMGVGSSAQPALTAPNTRTQIYKFDVTRPGRPLFEASGEVPGSLINQYAMSEYDGKLRVVTTTIGAVFGGPPPTALESALHVLQQRGEALVEVGRLDGLGNGERVYSVRFVGSTGYVVTFRQTDPLYILDLRDPENPAAVGELKLTGYSAYLHPAGNGRLIGVGQEANARGRVLGTQVSLFDVRDPANPYLLSRYQLNGGHSESELDPHAFLFWAKTGLVLIPVTPSWTGALALTIGSTTIHELGRVGPGRQIRRSLVIGDTLWTVSETGLGANQVTTLADDGWVPF